MNRSYSKIRHIQEANLRLEKRFLNEDDKTPVMGDEIDGTGEIPLPKTREGIMALQQAILNYELLDKDVKGLEVASLININSCETDVTRINVQGSGNLCEIEGTTLCSKPCTVLKAVDGIYGANTKKAYDTYKSDDNFKEFIKYHNYNIIDDEHVKKEYSPSVNNWQIPATEDAIKAFQYFVWKVLEDDLVATNKGCSGLDDCLYKSILCGGNPCLRSKAVDGRWGANTKKAWNEYKDEYFKLGWGLKYIYNDLYTWYNGNQGNVVSHRTSLGLKN